MFIVFGDFTDGFVDAGKFGVCDNSTEKAREHGHYNETICGLTMMTLDEGSFQSYLQKSRMCTLIFRDPSRPLKSGFFSFCTLVVFSGVDENVMGH